MKWRLISGGFEGTEYPTPKGELTVTLHGDNFSIHFSHPGGSFYASAGSVEIDPDTGQLTAHQQPREPWVYSVGTPWEDPLVFSPAKKRRNDRLVAFDRSSWGVS